MIGLRLEVREQILLARLRVDIDTANAGHLREELWAELGDHGTDLVIDLGATQYLDSAGVDMLFRLGQSLRERRGTLRLVIPPDSPLRRLAEIVALPDAVPVHADLEDAIAAFRARSGCGNPRA